MKVPSTGSIPAEIMIIGEAPGRDEEYRMEPFVGASGNLLNKLLASLGILRTTCYITNVAKYRPPDNDISLWISDNKRPPSPDWKMVQDKWVDPRIAEGVEELRDEINRVQPRLIIALGNTPLWALTGNSGIQKWRGSRLSGPGIPCTIVPTLHPAAALRQEELIHLIRADLARAKAIYEGTQLPRNYKFVIAPTFEETLTCLDWLWERAEQGKIHLAGDLETRRGHIACFGIAWTPTEALCIPFLHEGQDTPFYWTEEQEILIVQKLARLFRHPNIQWKGQNYLYDCQYFWRFWGTLPLHIWDTMIGYHSIHSNSRKGLDFLSSLYAQDHIYWKDESKDWDEALGEKQLWTYNCKDCCITLEIADPIRLDQIEQGNETHHAFQQSLFFPVLRMMNRGIRLDTSQRAILNKELVQAAFIRQERLDFMAGHPLNPRSIPQLRNFFYHDLGLPVIRALNSDSITTNSPAMAEIANRCPPLKPLCQLIVELRSIGVFLSTFIEAELDSDARMRCSFAIAGPTTYRFSSSENAFGSGMNLQNLPVAEKEKIKSADYVRLPNIRKLFLPDPNYTFFDMDLDRADLQVVVWEANDDGLKFALRENLDLHCVNAVTIFDIKGIPIEELSEDHPNYHEHRGRIGKPHRDKAKIGVHATNYGVGDRKLATALGISVAEAARFRARWFGAHPGILAWHKRTEASVLQRGYLENPFGARLYKIGRFDLPEFLGWFPQSTVAGVINRALVAIDTAHEAGETSIQLLIQVHDSLAGQFLTSRRDEELATLRRLGQVVVPYPDPLIIPVGIKTSTVSWGACE